VGCLVWGGFGGCDFVFVVWLSVRGWGRFFVGLACFLWGFFAGSLCCFWVGGGGGCGVLDLFVLWFSRWGFVSMVSGASLVGCFLGVVGLWCGCLVVEVWRGWGSVGLVVVVVIVGRVLGGWVVGG